MRVGVAVLDTVWSGTPSEGHCQGTVAVTGLGQAVIHFLGGDGSSLDPFDYEANPSQNESAAFVAPSFVIESSPSTSGEVDWSTLTTVTGNTQASWTQSVNLTGARRVRVRFTSAPYARGGPWFRCYVNVHDGTDEGWLFLGASLYSNAFGGQWCTGASQDKRFGDVLNARDAAHFPVVVPGDNSGGNLWQASRTRHDPWDNTAHDGTGALLYGGQTLLDKWLDNFVGQYVVPAMLHNDLTYSSNFVANFYSNGLIAEYRSQLDIILAHGKTPVISRILWTNSTGTRGACIDAWNTEITRLLSAEWSDIAPSIIVGPDEFAATNGHTEYLYDGTHYNAIGVDAIHNVWATWMLARAPASVSNLGVRQTFGVASTSADAFWLARSPRFGLSYLAGPVEIVEGGDARTDLRVMHHHLSSAAFAAAWSELATLSTSLGFASSRDFIAAWASVEVLAHGLGFASTSAYVVSEQASLPAELHVMGFQSYAAFMASWVRTQAVLHRFGVESASAFTAIWNEASSYRADFAFLSVAEWQAVFPSFIGLGAQFGVASVVSFVATWLNGATTAMAVSLLSSADFWDDAAGGLALRASFGVSWVSSWSSGSEDSGSLHRVGRITLVSTRGVLALVSVKGGVTEVAEPRPNISEGDEA